METNTFGTSYVEEIDGERLQRQMDVIREYMLEAYPKWRTLQKIENDLDYPQASISAQLRHLKKVRFGGFVLEKQRREADKGTWEYRLHKPFNENLFENN